MWDKQAASGRTCGEQIKEVQTTALATGQTSLVDRNAACAYVAVEMTTTRDHCSQCGPVAQPETTRAWVHIPLPPYEKRATIEAPPGVSTHAVQPFPLGQLNPLPTESWGVEGETKETIRNPPTPA